MSKSAMPRPGSAFKGAHIQAEAHLDTLMQAGQDERWQALAAYLHHLPVETKDHWEFFRCVLLDLAALRQHQRAEDEA